MTSRKSSAYFNLSRKNCFLFSAALATVTIVATSCGKDGSVVTNAHFCRPDQVDCDFEPEIPSPPAPSPTPVVTPPVNNDGTMRAAPECGQETHADGSLQWKIEASPACSPIYAESRAQECGAEIPAEGKSLSCPGSIPSKPYTIAGSPTCGSITVPSCNPGDIYKGYSVQESSNGCGRQSDRNATFAVTSCATPDQPATCRDAALFGADLWKSCRLPQFGISNYQKCEHQSHGAVWKTCKLTFNATEMGLFLAPLSGNVSFYGVSLLDAEIQYNKVTMGKESLACLIKNNDTLDSPYGQFLNQLKADFLLMTGFTYRPADYDCSIEKPKPPVPIDQFVCGSDDKSAQCGQSTRYIMARNLLLETKAKIQQLLLEPVATANSHGELGLLNEQMTRINTFLDQKPK